ncbi:MAG: BON domain-containing protein [Erythrobacter sp.]|nr:MAG: BON domain-containing protein [Erythrobacter sp.]
MVDRYNDNNRSRQQESYSDRNRSQEEQFQGERDRQFGETYSNPYEDRGYGGRNRGMEADGRSGQGGYRDRGFRSSRHDDSFAQYEGGRFGSDDRPDYGGQNARGTHGSFRGDDFGGVNFAGNTSGYGGTIGGSRSVGRGYDRGGDSHERGFFEKAGDEISSWFGDEDAERRRREDHRGRGPANYTRSNERILEEACDRLTDDRGVDARNITVTVDEGEVTLDGKVNTRWEKRRAEDCVHDLSGVKHVQNNLRIEQTEMRAGNEPTMGSRSS